MTSWLPHPIVPGPDGSSLQGRVGDLALKASPIHVREEAKAAARPGLSLVASPRAPQKASGHLAGLLCSHSELSRTLGNKEVWAQTIPEGLVRSAVLGVETGPHAAHPGGRGTGPPPSSAAQSVRLDRN